MRIGPYGNQKSKRLRLEALEDRRMLACNSGQSTPIAISSSAQGTISTAGDSTCFSFSATTNDTYNLVTTPGSLADTTITLFDRDGTTQLGFDDNGGVNGGSRINWTAPTSGTYFVEIRDVGDNDTGTFTLDFFDDHGGSSAQATPVPIGQLVLGEIERSSDFDFFSFNANSGSSYVITVDDGSVGDPEVVLFDQDGLTQLDIAFSSGVPTELSFVPPASGTFFLSVVDRGNNGTGTFSVLINELVDDHGNDIASASALPASTFAASLEVAGDVDFFSFSATAGELYLIETASVSNQSFVSQLSLFDAGGAQLESETSMISWIAPSSGTFFIQVANQQNLSVNYILDVDSVFYVDDHSNSSVAATSVFLPHSSNGTNEVSGDVDFFSINATAGENYLIQTNSGAGNHFVNVIDADGVTQLAGGSAALAWIAPSTGNFFVTVGGSSIGPYTLDISPVVDDHGDDSTTATVVALPASLTGSTDFPGDPDFFSFSVTAGDAFIAQMNNGFIRIFDVDGATLLATGNSVLTWTAPSTGQFFVELTAVDSNTIGPYTFNLDLSFDDHGDDIANASALPTTAFAASLDYQGDVDFFSFTPTPGGRYRIDASNSFSPSVTVFNSAGTQLATARSSALNWWAPSAGGTYFIEVSGGIGTYVLDVDELFYTDDHGNAPSSATAATLPYSSPGTIEVIGDADFYSFTATAGDIHLFQIDSTATSMAVYDTDGVTELTSGNLATWTAPADGTYFVEIRDLGDNQTATYTLDMSVPVDDFGNDAANASPLGALPTSIAGSIDYQGDSDFFSLNATAGEAHLINVTSSTTGPTSIYDTDGVTVLATSGNGDIVWTAPSTGTYFIEHSFPAGIGGYTLDVGSSVDDFGNDSNNASPLGALPASINGSIEYVGDVDFFSLNANDGDIHLISVTSTSTGSLVIYDIDGVTALLTNSNGNLNWSATWTAPSTGTYFIEYRDNGNNQTGTYTLDVSVPVDDFGNTVTTAMPLGTLPASVTGSINYQGDVDFFSFGAISGDAFSVTPSANFTGRTTIYDTDGVTILSNTTSSAGVTLTAPSTGIYFVEFREFSNNNVGSYTLEFAALIDDVGNDAANATPLAAIPATIASSIDFVGDRDFYSMIAIAGEEYAIIRTNSIITLVTVTDSSGTVIASTTSTIIRWTAPTAGTYFIEVGESGDNAIGTYDLNIDFRDPDGDTTANATPIIVGVPKPGVIDVNGDHDVFSFTATAGESYTIEVDEGSVFDPEVRLIDQDGSTQLDLTFTSGSPSIIQFAPTVTGTYFVEVLDRGDNGTGTYTVTVTRDGAFVCDFVGNNNGCNIDDIDAFYLQTANLTQAMVQEWLTAASDPSNPLRPTSTTEFVFGDTNLDGNVDGEDLGRLLNDFGDPTKVSWGDGNLNGDAMVDSTDLGLLLGNFNFQSPVVAAVTATVPLPADGTDSEDEDTYSVIDHVFSDDGVV